MREVNILDNEGVGGGIGGDGLSVLVAVVVP
jgi:hypothetical protein